MKCVVIAYDRERGTVHAAWEFTEGNDPCKDAEQFVAALSISFHQTYDIHITEVVED